MNKKIYKTPGNDLKIYSIFHQVPENYEQEIDNRLEYGYGGFVINADFHSKDGKKYLCEPDDFTNLDERIKLIKSKNVGLWVYDEKGYPSGSADGLTLESHPEYEAKGFAKIEIDTPSYTLDERFEKIIYAVRADGTKAKFDDKTATDAVVCYAVKPAFEGSHAEKCGYGPRRYPNLMDKSAVKSFIECTYDKYYDNTKNFGEFEAVFTDEPSLMSAFVNCNAPMDYRLLAWQDEFPEKFRQMHGVDFYSVIGELFDESGDFKKSKVMYWETVAEMVNDAFFVQLADWCHKHDIPFSGHCLLEECITMHVPLYGNLVKCLKSFDYPGVDMLTGDPVPYKNSKGYQFAMAPKYVGSAARMSGKTKRVMCEICPLPAMHGGVGFTLEEEIGTMDLIFMSGINHINSYLDLRSLNDGGRVYADYFGRAAHVLRDSVWNGKIGMYYPIENIQGHYCPDYIGINNGAKLSDTEQRTSLSMFDLNTEINKANLDYTIIDADWITEAEIIDGKFSANGLEISVVVLPNADYIKESVKAKLDEFVQNGGHVFSHESDISSVISGLSNTVDYGISIAADRKDDIFVSPVIKDGKRVWYVINSCNAENNVTISLSDNAKFEVWHNIDGSITENAAVKLMPYTSVFVCEV